MKIRHTKSALSVMAAAMLVIVQPAESMTPIQWMERDLVVPDGPQAGQKWSRDLTPYVVEPANTLGPDEADNEIAVMKAAQTGFTTMIEGVTGHSIEVDPCNMMVVQPTTAARSDFIRDKLNRAIDLSPALSRLVKSQTSRSGEGSTTTSKQYPGGSLVLAIASSSTDLRSKTVKKAFCDEIDDYPDDLDKQGDPLDMIAARQTAFLSSGEWKRLYNSTPTVKGASKIEAKYLAGDQRRWHVNCPQCGEKFVFKFDRKHFKFNDQFPHEAHYVAPCCGYPVEPYEKNAMVRSGEWIATAPRPGVYKSYHFDALSSPFVPWDYIAEQWLATDGDPVKLKTFFNLILGLPYEVKGDAPDHVQLMERRETDLVQGRIPPMGLILVTSADVQMNGIYVETVAYGPGRQSWTVDTKVLEGDTSDPERGAFALLADEYEREFPDAFGGKRRVDAFGVDSGYRSHVVYTWVRYRHNAYALDGRDGWQTPPMGTPKDVDIDFRGKKIKKGAKIWPVGTWSLKAAHYANLRKQGIKAGHDEDPAGYCYFGSWLDEEYFKQITSEYLDDETYRGRTKKVWKVRAGFENHFLDCRIYNMALAEHLGVSRMTDGQWAELALKRGVTEQQANPGLFASEPQKVAAQSKVKPQQTKRPAIKSSRKSWFNR